MRRFFARLASRVRQAHLERELSREIQSHLDLIAEDFERRGLSPEEARLAARRTYGGVEQAKELHREARSFPWLEHLLRDVRYGGRNLWRTPGFTAIAVLTLALGIGANIAVFHVVSAVLLRPLAYRDPGRLVTILHDGRDPVAVANYVDWRDQSRSFEAMAAAEYWSANLTGSDQPEHLVGLQVTQNLLPMLGIAPLMGRVFAEGEDHKGSEHRVVLSYRLWVRRFGSDPAIVGKPISLNAEVYTVVGVMPEEFRFAPFWATRAELWVPAALGDRVQSRGGNSLRVFARLKPQVSLAEARADMATVTARLEQQYPATNRRVVVTPLRDNVVGNVETPLLVLLGAVGFVLLIACANVAHMLLARTSDRQREIALRLALGATRGRVIAQFLTENLLLASLGSAVGLVLAAWETKALLAIAPPMLPRAAVSFIDANVLLFLLGITGITALAFGLAPAMQSTVGNLSGALKEGGRGGSGGVRRSRMRSVLVVSEFALAFILLIGAGLMIRSFVALQSVDPGFHPHNVLSMIVSVAGSQESEAGRRTVFYRQLLEQVRALPGVKSASAINHLPLAGDLWGAPFTIAGRPPSRPGESPNAVYRLVMPGYFETMRLPLLRGRDITDADDMRAPGVVIVNERAASQYWPGEEAIGKRITFGDPGASTAQWLTVIAVAANAKQGDWAADPRPEVYLAGLQNAQFLGAPQVVRAYLTLVVRASADAASLAPAVKQTVWSLDRNLPISDVLTMDQVVADANAQPRFEMLLLGVFAAVALLLAAVGIYGVMSYSVSRRTHEIGIRMSLGASRADVLWIVVRQGMLEAMAGMAAGVAGALLLSTLMTRMLYSVRPTDPLTFGGVAAVLAVVALLAACIPARKAARIEPVIALRTE